MVSESAFWRLTKGVRHRDRPTTACLRGACLVRWPDPWQVHSPALRARLAVLGSGMGIAVATRIDRMAMAARLGGRDGGRCGDLLSLGIIASLVVCDYVL